MHKYRAAARQAAWYTEQDDLSPDYNPFGKIRTRYEDESPALHRAQPLQVFSSRSRSNSEGKKQFQELESRLELNTDDEDLRGKQAELLDAECSASFKEEVTPEANGIVVQSTATGASKVEAIHGSLDEEHGVSIPPRALASWKSWSQQKFSHLWRQLVLASGSRRSGDVKQSVAGIGMSVISHAPLGTKGAPFLLGPGRRKKFMVIEYAKQSEDIRGTQRLVDIQ